MTKKLRITIGPNRHEMKIANINDSSNPTVIDSELFVGRVLIKIRDFDGITPDGSKPIRDHVYFDGRSRKFDIQIEGRFKRRPGVPLYSGEEVHFGSDFDHLVDFPKSAFNAGMRVARWIDPNTFYELSPPNGRPFIMSPYLACMNTLCAWPAPHRLSDAVVCLRQSDREVDLQDDEEVQDMVPIEQVDEADIANSHGKKKVGRHPRRYWRFIGLRGDGGRIDALLEKNKDLVAKPSPTPPTPDQSLIINQRQSRSQSIQSSGDPSRLTNGSSEPQAHGAGDEIHPDGRNKEDDDVENDNDDDDDALSCRAPSSQATYATAIEGSFDCIRPLPSSASSYHFSPRIFPRHQVSLGAGMRDLYQDAEIEANEREGEAQVQRMMDTVGEDEPMINPHPTSVPIQQSDSNQSLGSDDQPKKAHKKVKHRFQKLKTALSKLTPSSIHSSPNRSGNVSPSFKHYSTALHGKTRKDSEVATQCTVSRASSRTLPRRNLSQALRSESRSSDAVQSVHRRATLMPRPQSHHPSSNSTLEAEAKKLMIQLRSTSFDHPRPLDPPSPLSPVSSERLGTITGSPTSASNDGSKGLTTRTPSNLSRTAKSDHTTDSLAVASSPSTFRSGSTSETSTSPGANETHHGHSALKNQNGTLNPVIRTPDSEDGHHHLSANGKGPAQPTKQSSNSSLRPSDAAEDFESGTGSSVASGSTPRGMPVPQVSIATIRDAARNAAQAGSGEEVAGGSDSDLGDRGSSPSERQEASPRGASRSGSEQELNQELKEKKTVSQSEIDQAPELKDVEEGDLMFADMLNLSGGIGTREKDGPIEKQLGPWRFGNPTTDILEDNTFVFLNKSVDVQKRRKFFSEGNGKNRKSFTYDPDVVYATSFFSPFMDFNTFDLAIGPVKMNVSKVLGDMPIRYTLRSTRLDKRKRKEKEGKGRSKGKRVGEEGGGDEGGSTKKRNGNDDEGGGGGEGSLRNDVDGNVDGREKGEGDGGDGEVDDDEEGEEIEEEEIFVTIAFELVDQ